MKIIGYTRVSTQEQAKEGVSLDAQEADIRGYCNVYKQHSLLRVVRDEGWSGSTLDRPGVQEVLQAIKAKEAEGIIVAKLDRLSRSVRDLGTMAEGNIPLLSVHEQIDTSSATGRLVFHMIGAIAQWERETIVERIRRAMSHLKERGIRFGELPYGLTLTGQRDKDGYLEVIENPEEMRVIQLILSLRRNEKPLSYEQIAHYLNEKQISTKKGGKWYRYGVWKIARRCGNGNTEGCDDQNSQSISTFP